MLKNSGYALLLEMGDHDNLLLIDLKNILM